MIRDQSIIGQKFTTNSGHIATIIGGNDTKHLTIQFEDGMIRNDVRYYKLKQGKAAHPLEIQEAENNLMKNHIGETFITNAGNKIKIIDGINKNRLTIQFEDGTIRNNIAYSTIKNGHIAHLTQKRTPIKENEIYTLNSGLKVTVTDATNCDNMTIQFDDKILRKNIRYKSLTNGSIRHPYLTAKNKQFHSIILNHKYGRYNCAYDCTCEICGKNMLLTPVGLMQHHLTCQKET